VQPRSVRACVWSHSYWLGARDPNDPLRPAAGASLGMLPLGLADRMRSDRSIVATMVRVPVCGATNPPGFGRFAERSTLCLKGATDGNRVAGGEGLRSRVNTLHDMARVALEFC
jgi:hypothetical protein